MASPWQPIAYILGEGILVGLIAGAAVRRLNKVIAATVGSALLLINALWFIRFLDLDIPVPPQLDVVTDVVARLIPVATQDLARAFGPALPLITSVPFVAGALIGGWLGFKVA